MSFGEGLVQDARSGSVLWEVGEGFSDVQEVELMVLDMAEEDRCLLFPVMD